MGDYGRDEDLVDVHDPGLLLERVRLLLDPAVAADAADGIAARALALRTAAEAMWADVGDHLAGHPALSGGCSPGHALVPVQAGSQPRPGQGSSGPHRHHGPRCRGGTACGCKSVLHSDLTARRFASGPRQLVVAGVVGQVLRTVPDVGSCHLRSQLSRECASLRAARLRQAPRSGALVAHRPPAHCLEGRTMPPGRLLVGDGKLLKAQGRLGHRDPATTLRHNAHAAPSTTRTSLRNGHLDGLREGAAFNAAPR